MRFTEDEGVRAHETYAAHLSWMAEAAETLFARQRGNLRAEDRKLIEDFRTHHAAALDELRALRAALKERV